MKLVTSISYYPYTQKPADCQPYRPIYMFRGPPPDAGFSYGLFEDVELTKRFYAPLGLEEFSPLTGKNTKLIQELTSKQLERLLGDDLKKENLKEFECKHCGSQFFQNLHLVLKDREFFCHCCGSKL